MHEVWGEGGGPIPWGGGGVATRDTEPYIYIYIYIYIFDVLDMALYGPMAMSQDY